MTDFEVLAIDPGGTTGLCYGVLRGKTLTLTPSQGRFTPLQFKMILEQLPASTYVVCESFEYRKGARAGLDLTPAHLIGVVMACVLPPERVRFQTAAQGKGYWSNDKLKSVGAYKQALPHAMDATRHLLHWYKFGFGSQFYVQDTQVIQGR
jgi:hypothetical protein